MKHMQLSAKKFQIAFAVNYDPSYYAIVFTKEELEACIGGYELDKEFGWGKCCTNYSSPNYGLNRSGKSD